MITTKRNNYGRMKYLQLFNFLLELHNDDLFILNFTIQLTDFKVFPKYKKFWISYYQNT